MEIKSSVWSNVFFLIPLILSIIFRVYVLTTIITLVIITSVIYHTTNNKKLLIPDKILAYTLIIANLTLLYFVNFKQPYFIIAFFFVIVGIYFLKIKKKDGWEWHLSSTIITILCILAYSI